MYLLLLLGFFSTIRGCKVKDRDFDKRGERISTASYYQYNRKIGAIFGNR